MKQSTVETSVFGAEYVAMKHDIDALRDLRYKLRMMGNHISRPSYIYEENMSVVHNTYRPESVLRKESNQVCIMQSVSQLQLVLHIFSKKNAADLMTKVLFGQKGKCLVSNILTIFKMTISYEFQLAKTTIKQLDPISNSIKNKRTRKMQP